MKQVRLSVLCFAIAALPLSARILSPEEALQRASIHTSKFAPAAMSSCLSLAETRTIEGVPVYYVFTTGEQGFKILSADDCGAPVLGFSNSSSFDPANIPPGLQYMLDLYAEEIASASVTCFSTGAGSAVSPLKVTRESISPMVTSRWNQDAPYYDMTPVSGGQHTVTGCTATALAQVMYYHKWPEIGQGSISYYSDRISQNLSIDFSDVKFDWDNMTDTYNSNSTQAQKDAVALLMKAVGYSLKMNYSTGESGAYSQYAAVSLWKYFGYDKGTAIYYRNIYGIGEWEEMIYNNLRDCGPVLYSGYTNPLPGEGAAGHSFVCDGYDSASGLFHINWGWGGISDGYFALTGLDPASQGIGGANSGFSKDQVAILGIRPPAGNKEQEPIFGYTTPLLIDPIIQPDHSGFNIYWLGMLSAQESLKGHFGTRMVFPDGHQEYLKGAEQVFTNENWWAAYGYGWYISEDGEYKVYPVFTTDDGATWYEGKYPVGTPQYAIVTKTGYRIEVSYPEEATITADDLTSTPLYSGAAYEVTAMLKNDSDYEYYRSLRVAFARDNDVKTTSEYSLVDVTPHSTKEMVVRSTLPVIAEGEYDMYVIDENNVPVSPSVKVNIGIASTPSFNLIKASFVTDLGREDGFPLVNINEIHIQATVECTSGFYGGQIYAYIFPTNGGTSLCGFSSPNVYIGKGDRVDVDIIGSATNLNIGQRYMAILYTIVNGEFVVISKINMYFIAAEISGIENPDIDMPSVVYDRSESSVIVTGTGLNSVIVYTLSGSVAATAEILSDRAVVSTSALNPGMYLVKVLSATGTVTQKIII